MSSMEMGLRSNLHISSMLFAHGSNRRPLSIVRPSDFLFQTEAQIGMDGTEHKGELADWPSLSEAML